MTPTTLSLQGISTLCLCLQGILLCRPPSRNRSNPPPLTPDRLFRWEGFIEEVLAIASLDNFFRTRNTDDKITLLDLWECMTGDQVFRTLFDNCYYYAGTFIKDLQDAYEPTLVVGTSGSDDLDKRRKLKERKAQ